MTDFEVFVDDVLKCAEKDTRGKELLNERDQIFQIQLSDYEPLYVSVKGGNIEAKRGTIALDWRIKDWDKASCVFTDKETFRSILLGDMTSSEALFNSKLCITPRGKRDVNTWFLNILRIAKEQAREESMRKVFRENL
jgi:hypothetical protein